MSQPPTFYNWTLETMYVAFGDGSSKKYKLFPLGSDKNYISIPQIGSSIFALIFKKPTSLIPDQTIEIPNGKSFLYPDKTYNPTIVNTSNNPIYVSLDPQNAQTPQFYIVQPGGTTNSPLLGWKYNVYECDNQYCSNQRNFLFSAIFKKGQFLVYTGAPGMPKIYTSIFSSKENYSVSSTSKCNNNWLWFLLPIILLFILLLLILGNKNKSSKKR